VVRHWVNAEVPRVGDELGARGLEALPLLVLVLLMKSFTESPAWTRAGTPEAARPSLAPEEEPPPSESFDFFLDFSGLLSLPSCAALAEPTLLATLSASAPRFSRSGLSSNLSFSSLPPRSSLPSLKKPMPAAEGL